MSNRRIIILFCGLLSLWTSSCRHPGHEPKTVLVHYMPWYTSRPVTGTWGWHWTMTHFNPDRQTKPGRVEASSHFRPLIGLYDSSDPHALECHVLLMKLAGIDGVIVDWYGIKDAYDYAPIHHNTQQLVSYLKKAGLRFAVCYEDQSIGKMVASGALKESEAVAHGTDVMTWLHQNWFSDPAYLTLGGRPILLVFGPQYFAREQWHQMLGNLTPRPLLYTLPDPARQIGADGAFGWPPVHGGGEVAPETWRAYLRDLYARGADGESIMAPVFPGFQDIYSEAGVQESYGRIDPRGGATFEETLDAAWQSGSRLIQIITWNDYGEGTVIEPTAEDGYRYLDAVQKRARARGAKPLLFQPADLRLPVILYELRKQLAGDATATAMLDEASALLFSSNCDAARAILDTFSSATGQQP